MPEVYATGNGAIRARIEASGAALNLFRAAERNRIIREALIFAGTWWLGEFKPKRFTDYVNRQPFGYPRRPTKLATIKLRTAPRQSPLGIIWARVKISDFFGWDPWGNLPIPHDLETKWLSTNRSKYIGGGHRGGIDYQLMHHDIRKWAKDKTRDRAASLAEDGVMLPLVLSGELRDNYSKQSKARATSTATKARLTITIPRGNRQNKWAVRILGTLPVWEFNAIVRWFDQALSAGIATGLTQRFTQSPDGRSVGGAKPRTVGGGQRAPGKAA